MISCVELKNKINKTMKTFIELLERKIAGCDALGGLEREKAVYQSVLKDYKKQLTIPVVSQQRGVLKAYHKHLDSFNDPTIYNASEEMIDDYLANNCG